MSVFGRVSMVAVLGVLGVLVSAKSGKREFIEQSSRQRACIYNQRTLDKVLGVYESQHDVLPRERIEVKFDTRGRVVEASESLAKIRLANGVAPFAAGATLLFDYTKDVHPFRCPSRWNEIGGDAAARPEVHYVWISSPVPELLLDGQRRGVLCTHYGRSGPADSPDYPHRPGPSAPAR